MKNPLRRRIQALVLSAALVLSMTGALPSAAEPPETVGECGAVSEPEAEPAPSEPEQPPEQAPLPLPPAEEEECTCEALQNLAGAVHHARGCPLYEEPVCTIDGCTHSDEYCALAPACDGGEGCTHLLRDEQGEITIGESGMPVALCALGQWLLEHMRGAVATFAQTGADTSWYVGHEGDNEYTLSNEAQLRGLADLVIAGSFMSGKTIKLGSDIALTSEWTPIGTDYDFFDGTFDGMGHSITGLTTASGTDNVGLFSGTGASAVIRNVSVSGTVTNGYDAGLLVGVLQGRVENCSVHGEINVSGSRYIGGLVGRVESGASVRGCYSDATVAGGYAGGIAGSNGGDITDCYTSETVVIRNMASTAGGIAGDNTGAISRCYAAGSVRGDGGSLGGIVGTQSDGTVSECVVLISGLTDAYCTKGRLAGTVNAGNIQNCYVRGDFSIIDDYGDPVAVPNSEENGFTFIQFGELFASGGKLAADYSAANGWQTAAEGCAPLLAGTPGQPGSGMSDGGGFLGDGSTIPGAGTEASPYLIHNAATLKLMSDYINANEPGYASAHYRLLKSIDMSGEPVLVSMGHDYAPFSGTFDGKGLAITNVTIGPETEDGNNYAGLFGCVSGGTIRNLQITGTISDPNAEVAGMIAGKVISGTIEKCSARGNLQANTTAGGIVGTLDSGSAVRNCYAGVTCSGGTAGGIAGYSEGTVNDSYSDGIVTGQSVYTGGIVGNNMGTVTRCYAAGQVSDSSDASNCLGGITGTTSGTVQHCVSLVETIRAYGGRIMSGAGGTITGCYARGDCNVPEAEPSSEASNAYNGESFSSLDELFQSGGALAGEYTAANGWKPANTDCAPMLDGVAGTEIQKTGGYGGLTFSGSGVSEADPYVIDSAELLKLLSNNVAGGNTYAGKHFKVTAPVSVEDWTPIGTQEKPFSGSFDGGSQKLTVTMNGAAYADAGLFGYVTSGAGAYFRNIDVQMTMTGQASGTAGGIAGTIDVDKIENCMAAGTVSGAVAGGIAGKIGGGGYNQVSSCSAQVTVQGTSAAGGIAGEFQGEFIRNCYSTGTVGGAEAGGLAGSSNSSVTHSYSSADVNGTSAAGGLIGSNSGTVSSCYAAGAVNGASGAAGGVAGSNTGTVSYCAALGSAVQGAAGTTARIAPGGSLMENYARNNLLVNGRMLLQFFEAAAPNGRTASSLEALFGDAGTIRLTSSDGWLPFSGTAAPKLANAPGTQPDLAVDFMSLSGEGTFASPFLISDKETLTLIAENVKNGDACNGLYFALEADLTLGNWEPIGPDEAHPFSGHFDGRGHQISLTATNAGGVSGLFGVVSGTSAEVFHLAVTGGSVTGKAAGAVAGKLSGGAAIRDCYSTIPVSASDDAGGIVGEAEEGVVDRCYSTGVVSSSGGRAGGIAGSCGANATLSSVFALNSSLTGAQVGKVTALPDGSVSGKSFDQMVITGALSSDVFANGTAMTAADVKKQATFADLGAEWTTGENAMPGFGATWAIPEHLKNSASMTAAFSEATTHVYGDTVSITATLEIQGPAPSGTVYFYRNGATDATYSTTTISSLGNGKYSAVYSGVVLKNVGTNAESVSVKYEPASGAASLTAEASCTVSKKNLTVSITAQNKEYNGDNTASLNASITDGKLDGDDLGVTATGTFADKAVGEGKKITYTAQLTGAAEENYALPTTLPELTAAITQKALTVSLTPKGREYNGTNSVSFETFGEGSLTGVVRGDDVSIESVTAKVDDKNASVTPKDVTVSAVTLAGEDKDNYKVTLPNDLTVTISKKKLTATLVPQDREYDGTTNVTFSAKSLTSSEIIQGDNVSIDTVTATVTDKNASDTAKDVTVSAITLMGADAGNYEVSPLPTDLTVKIRKKKLTATLTPQNREYDGTTDVTFSAQSLTGSITGETVSVGTVTASVEDKNASDTAKTVTVSAITLAGADADNYEVDPLPMGLSVTIRKRALTVTPNLGQTKTFGGSDPDLTYIETSGTVVPNDSLSQVLTRAPGENAGSYAISKHSAANTSNPNYAITVTDGVMFTINKASGLSVQPKTVYVQESDLGTQQSVDLTQLSFQAGGSPVGAAQLGTVSYEVAGTTSNGLLSGTPTTSGSKLSYSLAGNAQVGTADDITVTVSSTNYEDATATIHVELPDKIVPVISGTVTVKDGKTLTYGQALSELTLEATFVDPESPSSQPVAGTIGWVNPDYEPNAGSYSASWEFQPEDTEKYMTVSGTRDLTVAKAAPAVVFPTASPLKWGQTLSESVLTGGSASGGGTFAWTDGSLVPEPGESAYSVTLTPADTSNYDYDSVSLTGLVTISVRRLTVTVTASGGTKVYDGTPLEISSITVTDEKSAPVSGAVVETSYYKGTAVDEAQKLDGAPVDAGTYVAVVSVAQSAHYEAGSSQPVSITIEQASGAALPGYVSGARELANGRDAVLTDGSRKTLADIQLPEGWTWDTPAHELGSADDGQSFTATYHPADANYAPASLAVTLRVSSVKVTFDNAVLVELAPGESRQVSGTVTVTGGALGESDYRWTSQNDEIAGVSASLAGTSLTLTVTGKARGLTLIGLSVKGTPVTSIMVKVDGDTESNNSASDLGSIADSVKDLVGDGTIEPGSTEEKMVQTVAGEMAKLPEGEKKNLDENQLKTVDELVKKTGVTPQVTVKSSGGLAAPDAADVEIIGMAAAAGSAAASEVEVRLTRQQPGQGENAALELAFEFLVDGELAEPDVPLFITVPVPPDVTPEELASCKLKHYLSGGGVEELAFTVENGKIKFRVNSFSAFVFEKEGAAPPVTEPDRTVERSEKSEEETPAVQKTAFDRFWERVAFSVRRAKNGETVQVDAGAYEKMPTDVLRALAGRDVTLVIDWNGGEITISGKTLKLPKDASKMISLQALGGRQEADVGEEVFMEAAAEPGTGAPWPIASVKAAAAAEPAPLHEAQPEPPEVSGSAGEQEEPQAQAPVARAGVEQQDAMAESEPRKGAFAGLLAALLVAAAAAAGILAVRRKRSK